jgi:nicotinamidase-related amidase
MNWKDLTADNIQFLLIDFQNSYFKLIDPKIVNLSRRNILLLMEMFIQMKVPMIGTDQYRKGLGATDPVVLSQWPASAGEFIDKVTFSCAGNNQFCQRLDEIDRPIVVVTGLETQICVLQTTIDLIEMGKQVVILNDAVLSSSKLKWENGIELLREAGAAILNSETLLFHLVKRSDSPDAKHLIKLLKDSN